jgi:hypothetical protein
VDIGSGNRFGAEILLACPQTLRKSTTKKITLLQRKQIFITPTNHAYFNQNMCMEIKMARAYNSLAGFGFRKCSALEKQ